MAWSLDARIPVILLPEAALPAALSAGPPAAVLFEAPPPDGLPAGAVALASFEPFVPHAAACGCCGGRGAAAVALDRLFQARVRGQCAWFDRVVAVAETEDARALVAAALAGDAVTQARFRAG